MDLTTSSERQSPASPPATPSTGLIANKKQNAANRRLEDRAGTEKIGYLQKDGDCTFVPWLGFIERRAARDLVDARAVRLVDISRIGHDGALSANWSDVPKGQYVHGCLTPKGAYAIYDAAIALVHAPGHR